MGGMNPIRNRRIVDTSGAGGYSMAGFGASANPMSPQQLRDLSKQRTAEVLNQVGSLQRFAPSPLQERAPGLQGSISFLGGYNNPFSQSFGYQRAPQAMYVNYPDAPPGQAGPLLPPQPPPGTEQPEDEEEELPEIPVASGPPGSYEKINPKPKLTFGKGMQKFEQDFIRNEHKLLTEHWNQNKERYYKGEELKPKPNFPRFVDFIYKGIGNEKGGLERAKQKYTTAFSEWQESQKAAPQQQQQPSQQAQPQAAQQAMPQGGIANMPQAAMQDIPPEILEQIRTGSIGRGMAQGGIASLEPQGMFIGGLMSAIGQGAAAAGGALAQGAGSLGSAAARGAGALGGAAARGAGALGSAAAKGLGGLKDIAVQGLQNYNANMAGAGGIGALGNTPDKPVEEMTREELIAYIRKIIGSEGSGGPGESLKIISDGIGLTGNTGATPTTSLMAGGGDVNFPRMNGPISGPGTETSDDIPAMLSDGEFVVNAKAVRGIGKLEGAGKSKAEQRRQGARMMYELQRAGEQAMRRA